MQWQSNLSEQCSQACLVTAVIVHVVYSEQSGDFHCLPRAFAQLGNWLGQPQLVIFPPAESLGPHDR
jgi:hypothetical protein